MAPLHACERNHCTLRSRGTVRAVLSALVLNMCVGAITAQCAHAVLARAVLLTANVRVSCPLRTALCLVEGGEGIGSSNRGRGVAQATKRMPPLITEFHSHKCLISLVMPSAGPCLSYPLCRASPILPVALVSHMSDVHGRISPFVR